MTPAISMATRTPSQGLPLAAAVLNALMAPSSIIPSTPRFSTPARSAKISPIVANSSTVPLATPAWRMMIGSMFLL
jgi:hypothetical protein